MEYGATNRKSIQAQAQRPMIHAGMPFRLAEDRAPMLSSCGTKAFLRQVMTAEAQSMSARETLRSTLVNLLEEEMGESFSLPQDDQDLRETLGLDSVDLVGLVMRIEREYHVRLAPEELAKVKQVGDLLDLMEAKLAEASDGSSTRPGVPEEGSR